MLDDLGLEDGDVLVLDWVMVKTSSRKKFTFG